MFHRASIGILAFWLAVAPVYAQTVTNTTPGASDLGLVTRNIPSGTQPVDSELPAAGALGDATPNPTAPAVGTFLHGWNGSAWDRLRSSIANGLVVDVSRVQGTVAATQSGAWTVTANAGTNLNTSALALDATLTGRLPAGASPADNESNTNTSLSRIGNFNFIFDGTAWDRWNGAVSQSGTWNINNISGTVSLPTGAATETTLGTRLADSTFTGRMPAGASPADNESNTNTSLSRIGVFNFVFDGTAWDRWNGNVTNAGTFAVQNTQQGTAAQNVTQFGGTNISTGTGAGGAGIPRVTISNDSSFAANQSVNVNQVGGVSAFRDRCQREDLTYIVINQTANTQLATGTASERIYICQIQLVTATAQNVALVSGTGSVCGTSTGGVLGGPAAATGWNFAANGGIVLGTGGHAVGRTDTDADNLCLFQSGAGQVSGSIAIVSN